VYSQPASDVNPPISNTTIDPTAFAAALTDIGTELTNSVDRLGRGAMQAPLAMGGNNITNAGAPIAQVDVARLADIVSYFPPGIFLPWAGGLIAPAGWLLCNGAAYLIATYPLLAAALGTGGTDGVSWNQTAPPAAGFFNVPDLRGVFLRGLDSGKGLDPSRVLATFQADMFASHTHIQTAHAHTITDPQHQHLYQSGAGGGGTSGSGSTGPTSAQTGFAPTGITINSAIAVNQTTGSTETAPKNLAAPFIIRT
jgi:hypothetical protein